MAHIHADTMAQYALDAKKYNEPWKQWEYYLDTDAWIDCTSHPSWSTDCVYRRKSRTINIAGYEVPAPVREPLNPGQKFWAVNPFLGPQEFIWDGCTGTQHALESGFVHLSEEAATQYYNVLKILLSGTTSETPVRSTSQSRQT